MGTNLSNYYSQTPLDSSKTSTTDAIKNYTERLIQKTAEAKGDLIGNKIADEMKSASKSSRNLHLQNDNLDEKNIPKVRYISSE